MLRKSKSAMECGASERRPDAGDDAARVCHSEARTPKRGATLALIDRAAGRGGRRAGLCLAEGARLLERALAAGAAIEVVAAADRALTAPTPAEAAALAAAAAAGVAVVAVADADVASRTDGRTFGDLLTVLRRPDVDVTELLAAPGPLVALERVLDPGNIGTIARTAAALGFAGMVVVQGTDPLHPKALRTSMGALFRLPVVQVPGLGAAWVEQARGAGRPSVATWLAGEPLARCRDRLGTPSFRRAVWWLGSEAHGLRPATAAAADLRVAVEMPGADDGRSVDSLSIGAAAAIALWTAATAAA